MTSFKTEYGETISYIPGYRKNHDGYGGGKTKETTLTAARERVERKEKMSFSHFIDDVFKYSILIDHLRNQDLDIGGEAALDIGGAEGTVARSLKGQEIVNSVHLVDISDLTSKLTTKLYMKYYKTLKMISGSGKYIPQLRSFPRKFRKYGYHPSDGSNFHSIKITTDPVIDEQVVGDAINYKHDREYDLIVACDCLPLFNISELFKKVSSLLTQNGVFVFLSRYYWYPVNATKIIGKFPYACQRLSRSDLKRYFELEHPELREDMLSRYDTYNTASMIDYIKLAHKNNLELTGAEYLIPNYNSHPLTPYPPQIINRFDSGEYLQRVLDDIHQTRKDITMLDLHAPYVVCSFKNTTQVSNPKSHIENIKTDSQFGYQVIN